MAEVGDGGLRIHGHDMGFSQIITKMHLEIGIGGDQGVGPLVELDRVGILLLVKVTAAKRFVTEHLQPVMLNADGNG